MIFIKKLVLSIPFIAALVAAMSFIVVDKKSTAHNTFTIEFKNFVGDDVLQLDSSTYKNEFAQTYTISKFKYYISNIHLTKKDGKQYASNDYFLVNEEDESSKTIVLNSVPDDTYTSISFTLGVDSLHNCSGAQSGALDPVNAMFWAWNTGYIFLKLEGKSAASKSPGNILEFHIGGYKKPSNCIRNFTLNSENYKSSENAYSIKIKTNAAEIFKTPTAIDFSKTSSVTDFHNATLVADNYADMFSVMY